MAYDEYLADRIRQQLVQRHQPYQERRMMGGLCFMVDDKMCLGVSDERLMVRAASNAWDCAEENARCSSCSR